MSEYCEENWNEEPVHFTFQLNLIVSFFFLYHFVRFRLDDLVQWILAPIPVKPKRQTSQNRERVKESITREKYEENSNSYWKVHFNLWTYLHIQCKKKNQSEMNAWCGKETNLFRRLDGRKKRQWETKRKKTELKRRSHKKSVFVLVSFGGKTK